MSTASILKVQAILFGNSKRGYTAFQTFFYFLPRKELANLKEFV